MRQQTTDTKLLEAIVQNDEAAFKTLFERYWRKIYATSFSYLHDREVCMEIVHDIFLSIWLKRGQLEIHSLANYLTSASRYQVYKRLQQKKTVKVIYSGSVEDSAWRPSANMGEEHMLDMELQENMETSLKALPERCREIFLLSRKDQLSIQEIAERLGISKRTVENQLTRALLHLRHSFGNLHIIFIFVSFAMFWMAKRHF